MFNPSIGVDDELSLISSDYFFSFRQGRFLIGFLDLLVPNRVTPLYPYLLLATSYLASYTIILYLHALKHDWKTHIGFLIFILFPTNWLSQEFNVNVPGFAMGLLATTIAALYSQKLLQRGLIGWQIISPMVIGLLVVAISAFQSLITLYLALSLGSLLFQKRPMGKPIFRKGSTRFLSSLAFIFANAAAAIVLHSILLKTLLLVSNSELHQINIYFRSPYFMLRTQPFQYISGNFTQFLQTYFTPGLFYGLSLSGFTLLLIGATLLFSIYHLRERMNKLSGMKAALLLVLLLIVPLSLNIISAPYRIPMRALVALPYIAWLASMVWLTLAENRHSFAFLLGVSLSGLLIVQCLTTISGYYAARAMNQRSDQLVASTIANSIIQNKQSGMPVSRIVSSGALQRRIPYATAWYSTAGQSFFNWDSGDMTRMAAWLDLMGVQGIKPVPKEEIQPYRSLLDGMQPWPAPGSVRVEGNTVLVKFPKPVP